MKSAIKLKYAILLTRFDEVFNKPPWGTSSIYRILNPQNYENIETLVKELKAETRKASPPFYFSNVKHKNFLYCLVNYLAIINVNEIVPILNFYLNKINENEKESWLSQISIDYGIIMDFYKYCIPELPAKKAEVFDWINKDEADEADEISIYFKLTKDEYEKVITTLTKKEIIQSGNRTAVQSFFNNDFKVKIYFKANMNVVIDLIGRMLFRGKYKKIFTKQQAANAMDNRIYYFDSDIEEFVPITATKFLKNGFSNYEKLPQKENDRLLLNIFPNVLKDSKNTPKTFT